MSKEKKRGDTVASSRSRSRKEKDNTQQRLGRQAQTEFIEMINKMFGTINAQIQVEPNANTLNNIFNKKDKKKLN